MRINKDILLEISRRQPSKEGLMFYKYNENGFKQRWFKLCSNLLFVYPDENNSGQSLNGHHPTSFFIMENFIVFTDEQMPNKFVLYFSAEPDVKYTFFCLNSRLTNEWFELFKDISYRKQRLHLNNLRCKLKEITGIDPLESTPWVNKL